MIINSSLTCTLLTTMGVWHFTNKSPWYAKLKPITVTMKDVSHRKKRRAGIVQVHVESPPTPLIKVNHNDKSYKDLVKIILRRDPMLAKSDLYELKMALFDNGELEEFLLFVWIFNKNLLAQGTLEMAFNIQYLRMILHV